MFPEVIQLSERYAPLGVRFLALSIDPTPDYVGAYLRSLGYPFARLHVRPWQPGEFRAAMASAGITIGQKVATPHIAVIDANGQIVGQWHGAEGARKAKVWLHSLGLRPGSE
jgi:hypothetical protein